MKRYWKSVEELNDPEEAVRLTEKEFPEYLPVDEFFGKSPLQDTSATRRDFLKLMGFSIGAATLASCEAPLIKSIPYTIKPEEIIPGVANWYASAFFDGQDYCPVLVKTREGRPIKVEGNPAAPLTQGAINARVQASVLSLYDSSRLKGPVKNSEITTWEVVDAEIMEKLNSISSSGKKIYILSSSIASPSTQQIINEFSSHFSQNSNLAPQLPKGGAATSPPFGGRGAEGGQPFPSNVKHVVYDAISYSAMIKANEQFFGKAVIPSYHFDKADIIVSVGADFLTNWLSPIEFSKQYGKVKKVKKGIRKLAKHIQFESVLSTTGCNADERIPVKPSQQGMVLVSIYNELRGEKPPMPLGCSEKITTLARHLLANKGKSLVVCGSNNISDQLITNAINQVLGNYGITLDLNNPLNLFQSDDEGVNNLITELKNGEVGALILYNVNPVYTMPGAYEFKQLIAKTELTVSFSGRMDESAIGSQYVCPDHHFLEGWNDLSPKSGYYNIAQPAINPIFNTRSAQECLLKWMGKETDYYSYIRKYWQENIFNKAGQVNFEDLWEKTLHDGFAVVPFGSAQGTVPSSLSVAETSEITTHPPTSLLNDAAIMIQKTMESAAGMEIVFYQKTGIGNGLQANNPWLQELPDPVSKVCWDNYLTMSPQQMREMGLSTKLGQKEEADIIELTVNGVTVKVPVFPQPGQLYGTMGLAVGYGRTHAGKIGNGLGVNAYPFLRFENGSVQYYSVMSSISGSIGKYGLASTQTHQTMMGRKLLRETSLEEYLKDPKSGNEDVTINMHGGKKLPPAHVSMWKDHPKNDQWWNLAIDLSSCIGCGACVVGCTAENNVPVVGKDEILRSREMHWIRIDRYFSSDVKEGELDAMEIPSEAESLEVAFQPVMCQHCNHAPCETVCPVAATTHSNDGLNMMAYNRCVGTRYCANNCPYKVRRFNWFEYDKNADFTDVNPSHNDLGRMVLNPDVVVRSRGVMEKCSMCAQRVQEGKLKAKKDGRKLEEGDIVTACQAVCPTNAITFGNVMDEKTAVAELKNDERKYYLLDELDTQPSVFYLTKVRNKS